ncbi:DNA cytosine methyltransferase [Xanthomonas citri]|uniref:DNA cytosine methyltransferase n=1 Tax=Xanthomonas citri TaxID=346 RepID=UPI0005B48745|nr:DNA cytosine methyltransferase [Xanthomonas citri]QTK37311.1 DNA cytosine methyltransferase [Xanthomonas citri pv. glycines]
MNYLSLFSGMEAAHLAWSPLGWRCKGVAEIDPAACALLRHRLPHVPNLGSVTDITDEQIRALGRLDVVIGGSPCQDLSVAGKRAGLGGARSGLFHHQLRIFNAARHLCGARWLVWENVPGAFSSNKGRDFAVVVGALAGSELAVPADGWNDEGVALGDNGLVEWSVLDAQWFGVAQRRRRVFAVLDTGDWAGRPPVLLERDSLRGDSAPSREARQSVAGSIAGGARQRGGYSTDDIPLIAGTLQANGKAAGSATQQDAESGMLVVAQAFGGGSNCKATDVSTALHAHPGGSRLDFLTETFLVQEVAHTLRAEGFDASEDGTGRGTPLVPVPFTIRGTNVDTGGVVFGTLTTGSDRATSGAPCIAFDCKAGGETAFSIGHVPGTLRAAHGGGHAAVAQGPAVRRLTPRECERLQGAEDDWTLVPNAAGKPMADGPRYKMLGNSFAVPVIHWIGDSIQRAHTWVQQERAA